MIKVVKNQQVIIHCILLLFVVMPSYGATNKLNGLDPTSPLGSMMESEVTIKTGAEGSSSLSTSGAEDSEQKRMIGNMVLEGVFHSRHGQHKDTVIINGQTLRINEYIGKYRLEVINDTSVILGSSGQRFKLSMFSSVVIK